MNAIDKKARSSVFRDRDALREQYSPDSLVGRDDEWDRLTDELMDIYWGDLPDDIVIYGPNGSGKTETIRKALDGFETAEGVQTDLVTARVNCTNAKNDTDLARLVINEFRFKHEKVKRGSHDVYETLWEELDSLGTEDEETILLLVLDEIARSNSIDEFVYQFSRSTDEFLDTVRPCLVAVSSDASIMEDLDSDSESSFNPTEIQFDPYDANQLRQILKHRADVAFRDTELVETGQGLVLDSEVLADDVIPLAAAVSTADGAGDARKALDVLSKAGKLAYREQAEQVTAEHVREAEERYSEEQVLRLLRKLDDNGQAIAYALVTLIADGMEAPSTARVYKRYKRIVNHGGKDAVSKRWARNHLNRLDKLGLTDAHTEDGQGSPKVHPLSGYEVETVLGALSQQVEFYGAHESIANLENVVAE
ncbi:MULTISPECIES: Cdc6/Cdc18 family protein [Halorussus]|uniref:Cdc6/Cdc18 family protein n=1 Tax=Halorussus TaxID=1070314 RepID=UPI00209DCFD2|nr:AAA family ATPase [Halorussus vallis]USZ78617.1 AAA family ATPase [Halorussus vallis]